MSMTQIAIKVPVIESERGWGSRVDDYMVCLTKEDANSFVKEFNSKNTEPVAPDWYMYADTDFKVFDLTESQREFLVKEKRAWFSTLKSK